MDVAQGAVTANTTEELSAAAIEQRVTEHYERRGRELFGLARRLGATDEGAADVLQETHLRLWQAFHDGVAINDVDAWTFRVAYRLVMDQHRLGKRIQGIVGRLTAGQASRPAGAQKSPRPPTSSGPR